MTPVNAIFRSVYALCMAHGSTFDYVPDASEKYPFIYVGEAFDTDTSNSELMGTVNQTIHIYGKRTDRNLIDRIATGIRNDTIKLKQAFGYSVSLRSYNTQSIADNSTGTPLIHYVLDLEFTYTKRG